MALASLALGVLLVVKPAGDAQTPETLCACASDGGKAGGGARTFEAFQKRYGSKFPDEASARWGFRVYKATNQCDAVMVIGRNTDTGDLAGKPGLCVLRTLEPWSPAVNDVYIQGGLDRQARFRLASPPPAETLGDQGEINRDSGWRVVYNRELAQIDGSGRYRIAGDAHDARPDHAVFLEPTCADVAGTWQGSVVVREVSGASQIRPGQKRNATVAVEQKGCDVTLTFGPNRLEGRFAAVDTATLDQHPTGALVRAEVVRRGDAVEVTLEQALPSGGRVVSGGRLAVGK